MEYEFKGWMSWVLIIGLLTGGFVAGRMTSKTPTSCSISQ